MSKLVTLNGLNEDEVLEEILTNEIIVYEDIQGSKIWVNWDGKDFTIKPKSLSSSPISLVDLAMQNYYNPAIYYFNSLSDRVKSLLNKNWWFCFEYFPDEQPANIEYDKVPKNKLVLTSINKKGKYYFDIEEMDEYSRLLEVDMIPIIFKGELSENMKEAIKYFINTSEKDLEYIFGEKSFSYFFYKVLNPNISNSFLMENDFQENVEKLIIKTSDQKVSFQLLNPLYERMSETNKTDFVEIYTLIIVNFLNFCQSIDIEDIKIKGDTKDECYIYLICNLFNIYVSEVKEDLLNFEFIIPEFFNKDKFKINTELISNELTTSYIEESDKLEYIFKIILGSMNKLRKKPIGVFTENTVEVFNKFVKEVNDIVDKHLGKMHEVELNKQGLLDFGDFFEIKYDVDADGQVYPDVYKTFGQELGDDKKKKGKGKFPSFGDNKKG